MVFNWLEIARKYQIAPAFRLEHAVALFQRLGDVANVLEDVVRKHRVEGAVIERKSLATGKLKMRGRGPGFGEPVPGLNENLVDVHPSEPSQPVTLAPRDAAPTGETAKVECFLAGQQRTQVEPEVMVPGIIDLALILVPTGFQHDRRAPTGFRFQKQVVAEYLL